MRYVMVSATGQFFIVEPFELFWTFEGLDGRFGYWSSRNKMINFYKDAFGFEYLGEL